MLPIVSFLALFGCKSALLDLKNDNQVVAERINMKQSELANLENQNQQLLQEKNKLLSELDQKNISLSELNIRLEKIKEANSKIKTDTAAKKKKRAALSKALDRYSAEINALSKDSNIGDAEKKKKIEELKNQIRDKVKKDAELFNNN
jgi:chromosome segregation ATPase